MERIPEKELMDEVEHASAYADADFSEPHDAFVTHFKNRFSDFSGVEVLDLGCGPADVTLRYAKTFPDTKITGVDGSQAMIDIGIRDVESQGLSHRITLKNHLLPDTGLMEMKFDAVISNSLLHHLKKPETMWMTVNLCAKPCAPIFVMDLLRPNSINETLELVKKYASDASQILKDDFYNSLLAAYSIEEIRQQLMSYGLHYLETEVISDRHFITWGRKETYGQ
jgi:ubiquinone/menaquinone biosynthesis C-methylase UbiE